MKYSHVDAQGETTVVEDNVYGDTPVPQSVIDAHRRVWNPHGAEAAAGRVKVKSEPHSSGDSRSRSTSAHGVASKASGAGPASAEGPSAAMRPFAKEPASRHKSRSRSRPRASGGSRATKAAEAMAKSSEVIATAIQGLVQISAQAQQPPLAPPPPRPLRALDAGEPGAAGSTLGAAAAGPMQLNLGHDAERVAGLARRLATSGDKLRSISQRMQVMAQAAQQALS